LHIELKDFFFQCYQVPPLLVTGWSPLFRRTVFFVPVLITDTGMEGEIGSCGLKGVNIISIKQEYETIIISI